MTNPLAPDAYDIVGFVLSLLLLLVVTAAIVWLFRRARRGKGLPDVFSVSERGTPKGMELHAQGTRRH